MPLYVYLIFLHLFAITWGLRSGLANDQGPVSVLLPLTIAIVVVLACARDAAARGTPIVHIGKVVMLGTWPVSAPVYLVWSRGWRGALWALLWGLTLYACFAGPAVGLYAVRRGAL